MPVHYRLTKGEILACCDEGYRLGFRTFLLQDGENPYYTDAVICDIVSEIRTRYHDCAIILSIGEEAAQCRGCPERRVNTDGYRIVTAIGNAKKVNKKNADIS